jgi:hypothetical protein
LKLEELHERETVTTTLFLILEYLSAEHLKIVIRKVRAFDLFFVWAALEKKPSS